MRKRKLYLSELLSRNKNDELFIRIITSITNETYTSKHDIELMKYRDCQVKRWLVTHSTLTQTLIVYL